MDEETAGNLGGREPSAESETVEVPSAQVFGDREPSAEASGGREPLPEASGGRVPADESVTVEVPADDVISIGRPAGKRVISGDLVGRLTAFASGRRRWLLAGIVGVLVIGVGTAAVALNASGGTPGPVSAAPSPAPVAAESSSAAPSPPPPSPSATQAASPSKSARPGKSSAGPTRTPAPVSTIPQRNWSNTNLALRGTATASSSENSAFPASAAFDGNTSTRWSSAFADPQWIYVDLGAIWFVSQVKLVWEHAYATRYEVDLSLDGTHWGTVYATNTGGGGTVQIDAGGYTARYVRMRGTGRSGSNGYSLFEFEVR